MDDKLISDVLDRQGFGSNVQLVAEENDCLVLRLEAPTGEGYMTMYHVMPGVFIMFNEFHLESCKSECQDMDMVFCIDHCRQGRMEHENSMYGKYYMESGDIRIDTRLHHSGNENMPTKYYHGVTIGFQPELAENTINRESLGINVDIKEIFDRFIRDDKEFLMRRDLLLKNDEAFIKNFDELYSVPKDIRIDFYKVKVLEILLRLRMIEASGYMNEKQYIPVSQAEKIKQIYRFIIDRPDKNYTLEELSDRFRVPQSTLRKNFSLIYGSPIYKYVKNYKMNLAAEMLINDKDMKISDIAESVGYDNPSKFSAAFKDVMGVTPMTYKSNKS